MIYFLIYVLIIICIILTRYYDSKDLIKKFITIAIPSALILLFSIITGKYIYRSPVIAFSILLPTSILVYKSTGILMSKVNTWIDHEFSTDNQSYEVVDTEVISKEDV